MALQWTKIKFIQREFSSCWCNLNLIVHNSIHIPCLPIESTRKCSMMQRCWGVFSLVPKKTLQCLALLFFFHEQRVKHIGLMHGCTLLNRLCCCWWVSNDWLYSLFALTESAKHPCMQPDTIAIQIVQPHIDVCYAHAGLINVLSIELTLSLHFLTLCFLGANRGHGVHSGTQPLEKWHSLL